MTCVAPEPTRSFPRPHSIVFHPGNRRGCSSPARGAQIIFPATDKHIAKFVDPHMLVVQETAQVPPRPSPAPCLRVPSLMRSPAALQLYRDVTLPYVAREELGDRRAPEPLHRSLHPRQCARGAGRGGTR